MILRPVSRRLPVPAWVVVVVLAWCGLVGLHQLLSPGATPDEGLCLLRRTTGIPCPTCGSTRAVLAAGRGDLTEAVLLNPLVMIALVAGAAWLVLRVGFAREVAPGPRTRRAIGWMAAAALVANWAYLAASGR